MAQVRLDVISADVAISFGGALAQVRSNVLPYLCCKIFRYLPLRTSEGVTLLRGLW